MRGSMLGPFELSEMQQRVQRGMVGRRSEISRDGADWRPASEFPEIFRKTAAPAPAAIEPAPVAVAPLDIGPVEDRWFVVLNGVQQQEPVPLATLQQYVASGLVRKDDVVWKEGWKKWEIVRSIPELALLVRKQEDPKPESSNGMAIAGFVLSLLGCTAPLGFIFSLVALNGRNQANRGLAIAGAVIGGIGTLACGMAGAWWLFVIGAVGARAW
ncbi:MAG: GYF domain-containing protein [Planctomycetia bacterium]